MISRQTKLQLLVFALVAVFGLLFTGARYAGLASLVPGHDNGYLVSADFTDSGGIFQGAEVTQRGVLVGKVEKLTLTPSGVRLRLRLKPGSRVPLPVKAAVGNRSAVGEQYVDLQPQSDGKARLVSGSVIPVSMTSIPIQPTQLLVNLDRLVRSVDTADVTTVLDELGTAFDGTGTDLTRLVDASNSLTEAATQYLPQTIKLIQDGRPVLKTQNDVSGQFQSYNRDLASLTDQLRRSDPDFRALFRNGTASAQATTALLEANRAALPVLLDNLVSTAQVQAVRIPALRQILVTYPNVVAGGFTVTPGDGSAHFGFVTNSASPPCTTGGYTPNRRRSPDDVSSKPANFGAYCGSRSPQTVRGANQAPRPGGLPPFPNDRAQAQASLFSGQVGTDGMPTVLADYDPSTGHAITATGSRYVLGSTGGADAVFGSNSWQWLLLDPLRS